MSRLRRDHDDVYDATTAGYRVGMERSRHATELDDVTGRRVEASPGGIDVARRRSPRARTASPGRASPSYDGAGVAAGLVLLVCVGIVITVLVAQNVESVDFDFLWWGASVPLAVIILAVAVTTLVIDQVVGSIWRRRRRHARELSQR